MPDLTETNLANLATLLNTGLPGDGSIPTATRTYTYAVNLTDAQPDAINYFPVSEDVQRQSGDAVVVRRQLKVAVECLSKGTASERPDARVLKLRNWVVSKLDGQRPASNQGPFLAILEDGSEFRMQQKDHAYCIARVYVVVHYQSMAGDLNTWAGTRPA